MVEPRQCLHGRTIHVQPAGHGGWVRSCHRCMGRQRRLPQHCASEYFPQRCRMVEPGQSFRRRAKRKQPTDQCGWVGSCYRCMATLRRHQRRCASEYVSQWFSMVDPCRSFHCRAGRIPPADNHGWVGLCHRRMASLRRHQQYCAGEFLRQPRGESDLRGCGSVEFLLHVCAVDGSNRYLHRYCAAFW